MLKCNECKSTIGNEDAFCGECGAKQLPPSEVSKTGFLLGTLNDLKACFSALLQNENHWNSLTADISDSDDFFQFFTDDGKTVYLNFPIRTERQNALHNKAAEFLADQLDLDPIYEELDNGDIDLVCEFPAEIAVSSMQASQLICAIFGIDENTEIRFQMI